FEVRKQLAEKYPGAAHRQDLADAHNFMAWIYYRKREPAAAVAHYRESLGLQTNHVDEGFKSPASRQRLAGVHVNLGVTLEMLNDQESIVHFRKAIDILGDVLAEWDKNRDLTRAERGSPPEKMRRGLATTHRILGRQLKGLGDPDAERHLAKSVAIQN